VLLDEIESMPLELQVKLLRALEAKQIERLGSNRVIDINVRFIAATKADLKAESEAGRFRADLYYRLNVVSVAIPPLRSHPEDIPQLFFQLAREARARYRREIPEITPELIERLKLHDWPGNVRELRNVADRFVIGLGTDFEQQRGAADNDAAAKLPDRMAAYERTVIAAALSRNEGRIRPVYEELGISRKSLYEKMKRYGL
jgi:two-component system C4-dicarboxylate transport response regulator DctD